MARDPNGRFSPKRAANGPAAAASTEPDPPVPAVDPSDAELQSIEAAWRATQLPAMLRTIRTNADKLFTAVTLEQRAAYRLRCTQHTQQVISMIEEGANDEAVIQAARKFYSEAQQMPCTPPPTPESEIERVAAGMMDARIHRVPYRAVELEVLKLMIRPGERIEGYTIRQIVTTERTILRRDLPRATVPAHQVRFGSWDAQFPRAETYESEYEPEGPLPAHLKTTVIGE